MLENIALIALGALLLLFLGYLVYKKKRRTSIPKASPRVMLLAESLFLIGFSALVIFCILHQLHIEKVPRLLNALGIVLILIASIDVLIRRVIRNKEIEKGFSPNWIIQIIIALYIPSYFITAALFFFSVFKWSRFLIAVGVSTFGGILVLRSALAERRQS